jgi:hypothetical protein
MVEVGMSVIWLLGLVTIFVLSLTQGTTTGRIEHKLDILLKHSAIDVNAVAEEEVERLITEGKKWAAVTCYRELTGAEKKTAKQHVDDVEVRLIQQKLQS